MNLIQGEKLRSCFIYCEPEHEQVGKIQLFINYSTTQDENSQKVCVTSAPTLVGVRLFRAS